MKRRQNTVLTCATAVALLVSITFTSLADLTLGRMSFGNAAATTLKTTTPLNVNLGRAPAMRFVGRVGGVAFDSIARPEEGTAAPTSILLNYDPDQPDGKRLSVTFDEKKVIAPIYDWELVPITQYANSDSTSCFTLFGDLQDSDRARALQEQGARILNYDQAFSDTLMGLRMFQLDVLVLSTDFATDLPKDDGEYILGAGESAPEIERARLNLGLYGLKLEAIRAKGKAEEFPTNFQSYVICDHNVTVGFSAADGELQLSGEPFYYFWKDDPKSKSHQDYVTAALSGPGMMRPGEDLQDFLGRKEKEINAGDNPALEMLRFNQKLERLVEAATEKYEARKGIYLEKYSQLHAPLAKELAEVNPAVWNAGRKTMRYSAFFRYCKQKFPDQWNAFVADLARREIAVEPGIETPTIMNPPQ